MRPYLLLPFVLILCSAARPSATTHPADPSRADVSSMEQKTQALLAEWKDRFAEEHFNYVVAPPFLLAGNGTPQQLARYRDGTVVASARALHAQFFKTQPPEPILILLFESEGPYRRLAKKWFDDDEVPHYGFYRHSDRTMLMNVATGTGTLVHELTHALIAPDFPDVPDWFNEGLASLYEQSSIGQDTIIGLPNWRLPALQKAIRDDKLRSLSDLITKDDFRGQQMGMNYAQARYLMLDLQEKHLLQRYYIAFRDHAKDDPHGIKSLEKIIAPQSLDAFEKDWRKWVLTLRFGAGG